MNWFPQLAAVVTDGNLLFRQFWGAISCPSWSMDLFKTSSGVMMDLGPLLVAAAAFEIFVVSGGNFLLFLVRRPHQEVVFCSRGILVMVGWCVRGMDKGGPVWRRFFLLLFVFVSIRYSYVILSFVSCVYIGELIAQTCK